MARRCTPAHELGHAMRGDRPTRHGYFDCRAERKAAEFAAHTLIAPEAVASAEALYGPSESAIARELEVTVYLLRR